MQLSHGFSGPELPFQFIHLVYISACFSHLPFFGYVLNVCSTWVLLDSQLITPLRHTSNVGGMGFLRASFKTNRSHEEI